MNKFLLAIVVPCFVSCVLVFAQYPQSGYYNPYYFPYGYAQNYGSGYQFPPAAAAYNYRLAQGGSSLQDKVDRNNLLKSLAALVFAVSYFSFRYGNSTGGVAG